MSTLIVNHNESQLLYSECIEGCLLEVREFEHYRWFTYGGDVVQGLMDKRNASRMLMPVYQSMLLFTLWKNSALNILNLGMGAASFERFFGDDSTSKLISVENCPQVISMAKKYFDVPKQATIHCKSAESYLQNNVEHFDVVLCDIFSKQQNVACINQSWFYEKLSTSLKVGGLVAINLDPVDERHTLTVLQLANDYFSNIAIIEFNDYKNIVLLLSQNKIPSKQGLLAENPITMESTDIDFNEFISSMHYLPVKNSLNN